MGSLLYTAGGFGLPFYVVGSVATGVALVLVAVLPKVDGVAGGGGGGDHKGELRRMPVSHYSGSPEDPLRIPPCSLSIN